MSGLSLVPSPGSEPDDAEVTRWVSEPRRLANKKVHTLRQIMMMGPLIERDAKREVLQAAAMQGVTLAQEPRGEWTYIIEATGYPIPEGLIRQENDLGQRDADLDFWHRAVERMAGEFARLGRWLPLRILGPGPRDD